MSDVFVAFAIGFTCGLLSMGAIVNYIDGRLKR